MKATHCDVGLLGVLAEALVVVIVCWLGLHTKAHGNPYMRLSLQDYVDRDRLDAQTSQEGTAHQGGKAIFVPRSYATAPVPARKGSTFQSQSARDLKFMLPIVRPLGAAERPQRDEIVTELMYDWYRRGQSSDWQSRRRKHIATRKFLSPGDRETRYRVGNFILNGLV